MSSGAPRAATTTSAPRTTRSAALHIARKHVYRGGDLDDLEQVAALGLIQAVDRFEPDRGIAFLSFAVPTVTGEVLRYFRDRAPVIRVPRRLAAMRPALDRATTELAQRLGRAPRPSELAALLHVDVDLVVDALQAQHAGCLSLDEPARDGGRADRNRFDDVLVHVDPELGLVEDREVLVSLLAGLSDRDRQIPIGRLVGERKGYQGLRHVGRSVSVHVHARPQEHGADGVRVGTCLPTHHGRPDPRTADPNTCEEQTWHREL